MALTKDDLKKLCHQIENPQNNAEILSGLISVNKSLKSSEKSEVFKQYAWFLDNILDAFKPAVSKHLSKDILKEIDLVTYNGPADSALLVLVKKIEKSDDSVLLNHSVQLLVTFLSNDRIEELLSSECRADENRQILHNDIITIIVSLPDRMANKLRHENRQEFLPVNYITRISDQFISTCVGIGIDLKSNLNRNVNFLGLLLGKLCQCGHGKQVWRRIIDCIGDQFQTDFVLSRVFEKVLSHVPGNSCESVLVPLLIESPCYGIINRLLGDMVRKDSRIKFLLTNKLLLHRYFSDVRIINNVIGYLSKFDDVYKDVMRNLLQVWSGVNYVKHTSYEQQLYVSSSILVGLAFLNENLGDSRSFLSDMAMRGVPHYLDCGVEKIRLLGMVVAEMITTLTTSGGESLKFEYQDTDDTRKLKSLFVKRDEFCEFDKADIVLNKPVKTEVEVKSEREVMNSDNDLDSDDDLEPYDVSDDLPKSKVKEPKYIRQCMEGFLAKEDPDTFEISLKLGAKLVKDNPAQARELAEEFAMIVVHTENQYETEDFTTLLRDLLVALISSNPTAVADRLCREFYARNYNIRQRLDILDALASAAKDLSKLDPDKNDPKITEVTGDDDWRAIVDRRIEAKTRRFASAPREMRTTENKFGPVAGHFFYPLIHPDSNVDTSIDIQGRDNVLLVRLLYTLGVVLHCAVNTPMASKMGAELLKFIWLFRTHSEVAVRRGVLFAMSMVFLSVPPFTLMTDMETEVVEGKLWLENVMSSDQDDVCRELAKQGLFLLVDALKKK